MENLRLHDKEFRLFIESSKIDDVIYKMANSMNEDLKNECPLFLSVLNGSFIFTADLLKQITIPKSEISFVKIASYTGTSSSGNIKELIGLEEEIEGRTIVILEDIIDSGRSMTHLLEYLYSKNVKKIVVATLFYKPKAAVHKISIDYYGIALENDFVVGRGLDYNGLGRNYPDLYILND